MELKVLLLGLVFCRELFFARSTRGYKLILSPADRLLGPAGAVVFLMVYVFHVYMVGVVFFFFTEGPSKVCCLQGLMGACTTVYPFFLAHDLAKVHVLSF